MALFDAVSERSGVLFHPRITSDDGDELRWFAQFFGSCEVDCVESADRLDRKRPPDTGEYGIGHRNNVTASLEHAERVNRRALIVRAEPAVPPRTNDRPARLGERKCGGCQPAASLK